jgi:geranylgeranyl reductase family protein
MRIAIVGAGPAGAHLAWLLSKSGGEVLLFDARAQAWEKPCGGGVTTKALREFDFLHDEKTAKQMVSSIRVISAAGREVVVKPASEFAIYSRAELDRLMRRRAIDAGARFICARIARVNHHPDMWELATQTGETYLCDFLVGADGATSKIRRRLGVDFAPGDFFYALGWHVSNRHDETSSRVDIGYLKNTTGYIWAFPRTDHLSFGIAAKYRERTPRWLKETLLDFIAAEDPITAHEIKAADHHSTTRATFYGAMIPALEVKTWDRLKACDTGQSWALVGDAAGFVDPLTGEGIYYALKSAELLAQALLARVNDYNEMWRAEFGAELRRAAQLTDRFYLGRFAGAPVTECMVQFARAHRGIRQTLNDLIAGNQGYTDLKPRLIHSLLKFA